MNKLTIIPFQPVHAQQIQLADFDLWIKERPNFMESAKVAHMSGPAWTGIRLSDGKIIGCAGIMVAASEGVAWALFSDEIGKYKKEAYSTILKFLKTVIHDLKLKRVTSFFRTNPTFKTSFGGRFGFKEAGILEGNDERPECVRYIWEPEKC